MGLVSFLWQRRRAIVGASVVAGAGYVAYTLWKQKQELEEMLLSSLLGGELGTGPQLAPTPSPKRNEVARLREHFEGTQRECGVALSRELPRVRTQVARLLDASGLRKQMKEEANQKQLSKAVFALWRGFFSSTHHVLTHTHVCRVSPPDSCHHRTRVTT